MGTRFAAGLVVALLVAAASPAFAGTVLVTPILHAAAGQSIRCEVLNAGTRAVDVYMEMVATNGVVSSDETFADIEAGGGRLMEQAIPAGFVRYCRFSGRFSKTAVRASAILQAGDSTIAIIEGR